MRGRFRLHLSTLLVLVIVAGVLVGLNVLPRDGSQVELEPFARMTILVTLKAEGWPMIFVERFDGPTEPPYSTNWWGLVLNIVFALLTLAGIWLLLERPWRKAQP